MLHAFVMKKHPKPLLQALKLLCFCKTDLVMKIKCTSDTVVLPSN